MTAFLKKAPLQIGFVGIKFRRLAIFNGKLRRLFKVLADGSRINAELVGNLILPVTLLM
jgi:hypothetical protein